MPRGVPSESAVASCSPRPRAPGHLPRAHASRRHSPSASPRDTEGGRLVGNPCHCAGPAIRRCTRGRKARDRQSQPGTEIRLDARTAHVGDRRIERRHGHPVPGARPARWRPPLTRRLRGGRAQCLCVAGQISLLRSRSAVASPRPRARSAPAQPSMGRGPSPSLRRPPAA